MNICKTATTLIKHYIFENILVEQGFIISVAGDARPLSNDQKKEQKQNKDAKQEQLFNEWLELSGNDRESKSAFTLEVLINVRAERYTFRLALT